MGGSLAAACRRKFPKARVIGISRSRKALQTALRKRWVHEAGSDIKRGVERADIIILCSPVDTFPKLLAEIELARETPVLVTDAGSVKGAILNWIRKKSFKHIQFVGAHPMVGSHERGIEAARSNLYEHGFTFVVRSWQTDPKACREVKAFWKTISPKIFELSPEKHDRIVGEISHLPHAAAVCLALSVNKNFLPFAAAGFRDATRIARGHASVWRPIFESNRKEIIRAITRFEKTAARFKKFLVDQDSNALVRMLETAQKALKNLT
jgi:prephenate dehydrogenase